MEFIPPEPELAGIQIEGIPHLKERYIFLVSAVQEGHPGKILDEAKSFLESIFRTVLLDVLGESERMKIEKMHMPELAREACGCTSLSLDVVVNLSIAEMCQKLIENIARLRHLYGASSHGRDGYHISELGFQEAIYVAQIALSTGVLFLNQHKGRSNGYKNKRIQYLDNPDFNAYLDEQEDVEVAGIRMLPSQVLFSTDSKGYRDSLNEFMDQKDVL
jgi:hypothetical protein